MVRHDDLRVNAFQLHEVAISPFTDKKVLNVHVTCASGWFLGIIHLSAWVVVLVEDGSGFLWNPKVPHDALYEEDHLPCIIRHHEFHFGG